MASASLCELDTEHLRPTLNTMPAQTKPKRRRGRSAARKVEASQLVCELEAFEAGLLPSLPLPVTLWLDVPGAPVPVVFTTKVNEPDPAVLADHVVFDGHELDALVAGTQADRLWRKDLLSFCFEKWRKPSVRISRQHALSGAVDRVAPEWSRESAGWSLGAVLARLGCTLERVEVEEQDRDLRVAA